MKELTKHIEALLVDNECVILPQFGGFVTNHTPAQWIEDEKIFLPPYRTIGFNSQLKINDGLLVQSYMLTHDATYPEANRLAEAAIEKLSQELYKEGQVELHGIGTLRRTIVGEYQFDPSENGVITPSLYGLGAVEMKTLAMLEEERKQKPAPRVEVETKTIETPVVEKEERTITIKIHHEWITNAVAAVAAVILFFLLSTPVDNTYIEEENYASLGDISVFGQIKKESLLTTLMEVPTTTMAEPAHVAKAKPASVAKVEPTPIVKAEPTPIVKAEPNPVAKAEPTPVVKAGPTPVVKAEPAPVAKAEPASVAKIEPAPQKKSASYNIIIASVPAESDAQHTIDNFAAKGHPGAYLIKGNGRFRIALKAYDNEGQAYDKVNELKKDPLFKDAWVLKTRK
jgi:nucleoid DNA-binding protein/outer membrane biosynthesis protein TonB